MLVMISLLVYGVSSYIISKLKTEVELYVPYQNVDYTDVTIQNLSEDSVQVYLTLQSPNSVVGWFGIKASDTTGICSQGYFYALKDSVYHLNCKYALEGWKISFQAPPMNCIQAIKQGYPNGINVVEGSINIDYESFDIGCIDGINCIIQTSVTDTLNWTTGLGDHQKKFYSATNKLNHQSNLNVRGIFPYRCTDCIDINPKNIPPNCYNLPKTCDSIRVCQVNRAKNQGGAIQILYYANEVIN